MMAIKLHRCPLTNRLVNKAPGHACGRVEKALDKQGIEYERVLGKAWPRSSRTAVLEASGQQMFPTIEFEDGSTYRAESKDMAAEIMAGRLFDHQGKSGGGAS